MPFLARTCGKRSLALVLAQLAPSAARSRVRPADGDHHRDVAKEAMLKALLAGRSVEWLDEVGREYARTVLEGQLRPEMVNQLTWHREQGHELILVSASLSAYLEPFGEAHGFDHVIAVDLAADDAGTLTGSLARPNVRGPEKAVRIRGWLRGDVPAFMWAYGNSSGDRAMLAMADQPVWIGRGRAGRRSRSASGARPQQSLGREMTMGPRP